MLRQVNTVPLSGGGSVIPQQEDYTYDGFNRIASITEAQRNGGGTWTTNVTSQTFTYDRWGNRLSVTGYNPQSCDTTEAAATNRLRVIGTTGCPASGTRVCYDAAGNLIFDNTLGSAGTRTYDAENRMITAAGSGANSYGYNADGKRTRRVVAAQAFFQVYGIGGELVGEYLWNGSTATLQKEYGYRGGEMLIATEVETVKWLVTDHLGTPRMVVDKSGRLTDDPNTATINEMVTRHDYFPFGEENLQGAQRSGNGYQADNVRQKYTGYERDAETNLDYAQARYYAHLQGRFTGIDPLHSSALLGDPQSWNRFSYVGNRPLVITDPTGMKWGYKKDNNGYWHFQYFSPDKEAEAVEKGWTLINGNYLFVGSNGHVIGLYENGGGRDFGLAKSPRTRINVWKDNQFSPFFIGVASTYLTAFNIAQGVSGIAALYNAIKLSQAAATTGRSVWSLAQFARGLEIERTLGGNLPAGFKTFDKFVDGVATSIKSLDTAATTYQSEARLLSKLTSYVDDVANFEGYRLGDFALKSADIAARELQVAIPSGGLTVAQQSAFQAASQYAQSLGVKLTTTVVP